MGNYIQSTFVVKRVVIFGHPNIFYISHLFWFLSFYYIKYILYLSFFFL